MKQVSRFISTDAMPYIYEIELSYDVSEKYSFYLFEDVRSWWPLVYKVVAPCKTWEVYSTVTP